MPTCLAISFDALWIFICESYAQNVSLDGHNRVYASFVPVEAQLLASHPAGRPSVASIGYSGQT
jgi:hypothetical protein